MKKPSLADLTPCELLNLRWVYEGKTCYEAGVIIGAAEATVKRHRLHIYKKLGVPNAICAANFYRDAMDNGDDLAHAA